MSAVSAGEEVVPASELSDALQQIRELQRLLGKKTVEVEILKEAVEYGRQKMDCALATIAGGRPVKQVCDVLGVARSNVAAKLARPVDWQDKRSAHRTDDAALVAEIQHTVKDLPSYGYRRV